jgi:hypothetical protein
VGGDAFDESDNDNADESASGEVLKPIAITVVTVADENVALRFRG